MTEESGDSIPTGYKVVLLGDSSVGKSSLVLRFVRGDFSDTQESTIGAAFLAKVVHVGGDAVKLDIWDTAGQERYRSLTPMYYRGANGAIVVYDITSYETFDRAKEWITELKNKATSNLVIALTGNKSDLADEGLRKVELLESKSYAEENNLHFFETSAKTNTNVEETFNTVAKLVKEKFGMTKLDDQTGDSGICESGKCGVCPSCRGGRIELGKAGSKGNGGGGGGGGGCC